MRSVPSIFTLLCGVFVSALLLPGSTQLYSQNGASENDTPPTYSRVLKQQPYKSPRLRAILKRGVLRVGMHAHYPPFRIPDESGATALPDQPVPAKSYPGIDAEVAHEFARSLGVRLEIHSGNIDRLMEMVQKNEIDMALGGISSTLHRARFVQFAAPYFITTPAVLLSKSRLPNESQSEEFARRKLRGIADLRRLESLVLGVVRDTTTHQLLREDPAFSKHKVEAFAGRDDLVKAFEKNQIDAIVADAIFITALTLQKPVYLVNAVALTQPYREEHLSPILAYGDPEFLAVINFFLKEMRRIGRFDVIERKYLESDKWVKQD